tara:strand:- start:90020 stop:90256 length:237 start_codon:yes stop_codon:yes gene_type:complete
MALIVGADIAFTTMRAVNGLWNNVVILIAIVLPTLRGYQARLNGRLNIYFVYDKYLTINQRNNSYETGIKTIPGTDPR